MSSWTLRAFSCRRTGAGLLRSGQRGAFRALYPSALFLACSAIDTGFSRSAFCKFIPIKAPYRAAGTQKWLLGTPRLRHPSVRLAKLRWQSCSEHTCCRLSPAAAACARVNCCVSQRRLNAASASQAPLRCLSRRTGVPPARDAETKGSCKASRDANPDDNCANVGPPHEVPRARGRARRDHR